MSTSGRSPGENPLGPEFKLIDKLAGNLNSGVAPPAQLGKSLRIGIGDDAAVWEISPGELGILTVDTMVETVHAFPYEPPEGIGARALTSAVSDISAMGGSPVLACIALQVPPSMDEDKLLRIYDGVREEAGYLEVAVVGGDVVDTPGPLSISISVFGTARSGALWTRSGAREGDVIAVTGNLGGSRAGVELLAEEEAAPANEWALCLIERHIRPHARVRAARELSRYEGICCAIDISDGLSSEAWHIALNSGVAVQLEAGAIPLHPSLKEFMEWRTEKYGDAVEGISAVEYAIDSGEEFELMLTLPENHPALGESDVGGEGPLTIVGRIVEGEPAVILRGDDWSRPIQPGGYSHLRSDGGGE